MPDPAPAPHAGGQDRQQPLIPRDRRFVAFLVGLLALNLLLSFATGGPASRQRVPYQPFFVEQVEAGNVREISSRGDSIEGELERRARYDPPGEADPSRSSASRQRCPRSSIATA